MKWWLKRTFLVLKTLNGSRILAILLALEVAGVPRLVMGSVQTNALAQEQGEQASKTEQLNREEAQREAQAAAIQQFKDRLDGENASLKRQRNQFYRQARGSRSILTGKVDPQKIKDAVTAFQAGLKNYRDTYLAPYLATDIGDGFESPGNELDYRRSLIATYFESVSILGQARAYLSQAEMTPAELLEYNLSIPYVLLAQLSGFEDVKDFTHAEYARSWLNDPDSPILLDFETSGAGVLSRVVSYFKKNPVSDGSQIHTVTMRLNERLLDPQMIKAYANKPTEEVTVGMYKYLAATKWILNYFQIRRMMENPGPDDFRVPDELAKQFPSLQRLVDRARADEKQLEGPFRGQLINESPMFKSPVSDAEIVKFMTAEALKHQGEPLLTRPLMPEEVPVFESYVNQLRTNGLIFSDGSLETDVATACLESDVYGAGVIKQFEESLDVNSTSLLDPISELFRSISKTEEVHAPSLYSDENLKWCNDLAKNMMEAFRNIEAGEFRSLIVDGIISWPMPLRGQETQSTEIVLRNILAQSKMTLMRRVVRYFPFNSQMSKTIEDAFARRLDPFIKGISSSYLQAWIDRAMKQPPSVLRVEERAKYRKELIRQSSKIRRLDFKEFTVPIWGKRIVHGRKTPLNQIEISPASFVRAVVDTMTTKLGIDYSASKFISQLSEIPPSFDANEAYVLARKIHSQQIEDMVEAYIGRPLLRRGQNDPLNKLGGSKTEIHQSSARYADDWAIRRDAEGKIVQEKVRVAVGEGSLSEFEIERLLNERDQQLGHLASGVPEPFKDQPYSSEVQLAISAMKIDAANPPKDWTKELDRRALLILEALEKQAESRRVEIEKRVFACDSETSAGRRELRAYRGFTSDARAQKTEMENVRKNWVLLGDRTPSLLIRNILGYVAQAARFPQAFEIARQHALHEANLVQAERKADSTFAMVRQHIQLLLKVGKMCGFDRPEFENRAPLFSELRLSKEERLILQEMYLRVYREDQVNNPLLTVHVDRKASPIVSMPSHNSGTSIVSNFVSVSEGEPLYVLLDGLNPKKLDPDQLPDGVLARAQQLIEEGLSAELGNINARLSKLMNCKTFQDIKTNIGKSEYIAQELRSNYPMLANERDNLVEQLRAEMMSEERTAEISANLMQPMSLLFPQMILQMVLPLLPESRFFVRNLITANTAVGTEMHGYFALAWAPMIFDLYHANAKHADKESDAKEVTQLYQTGIDADGLFEYSKVLGVQDEESMARTAKYQSWISQAVFLGVPFLLPDVQRLAYRFQERQVQKAVDILTSAHQKNSSLLLKINRDTVDLINRAETEKSPNYLKNVIDRAHRENWTAERLEKELAANSSHRYDSQGREAFEARDPFIEELRRNRETEVNEMSAREKWSSEKRESEIAEINRAAKKLKDKRKEYDDLRKAYIKNFALEWKELDLVGRETFDLDVIHRQMLQLKTEPSRRAAEAIKSFVRGRLSLAMPGSIHSMFLGKGYLQGMYAKDPMYNSAAMRLRLEFESRVIGFKDTRLDRVVMRPVFDPYKVLGVSKNATPELIVAAFRRKAMDCHPMISGRIIQRAVRLFKVDGLETFKEYLKNNPAAENELAQSAYRQIEESFEILMDQTSRYQFDHYGTVVSVPLQKRDLLIRALALITFHRMPIPKEAVEALREGESLAWDINADIVKIYIHEKTKEQIEVEDNRKQAEYINAGIQAEKEGKEFTEEAPVRREYHPSVAGPALRVINPETGRIEDVVPLGEVSKRAQEEVGKAKKVNKEEQK